MTAREVLLDGGSPWGFRMNGGADVGHALRISRVNPGSKAAQKGVREGDVITAINGQPTKCLTNGESHALLRTVGDTLRLGLNQDTSGSPKRRIKEPLKREASSSSTSQSTPSTPGPVDTAHTTILSGASDSATTPETTPSDQSEPTSAGAKVFVCGIWNSVNKSKHRAKNGVKCENIRKHEEPGHQSEPQTPSPDTVPKTSSSKARRLRKLKLKSVKKQLVQEGDNIVEQDSESVDEVKVNEGTTGAIDTKDDVVELVIVMDEEDVRKAGGIVSKDEIPFTEIQSDSNGTLTSVEEVTENSTPKTAKPKTKKKNNKNKGFSLTHIFTSQTNMAEKTGKAHENSEYKINDYSEKQIEEILAEKSVIVIPAVIAEASQEIVKELTADIEIENHADIPKVHNDSEINSKKEEILPELTLKETPVINPSTTFSILEYERSTPSPIQRSASSSTSSTLKRNKTEKMCSTKTAEILDTVEFINMGGTADGSANVNKTDENETPSINSKTNINQSVTVVKAEGEESRPISIFVVPPDNEAEESETPGVDWESVSDFEAKSQSTFEDDIHPETLVHLPSNDLQTASADENGADAVHVDDLELSVRDLRSPLIAPEEEAKLRSFLETLNLTKPEEYDDTSSSKSYGDSSSTISETSPIPPSSVDEIVVYKHMKSHSTAEPCYIPPKHQRYLDVITEETSDPSDSERKSGIDRPWESADQIKRNNDIEQIPNDWYGSEEEPETTSDEGGIDTSWRDGRKLEDVEGVEIVYLSDDDSDDGGSGRKNAEDSLCVQNRDNLPELVVVHAMNTENVKNVVQLHQSETENFKDVAQLHQPKAEIIKDSVHLHQPKTENAKAIVQMRQPTKDDEENLVQQCKTASNDENPKLNLQHPIKEKENINNHETKSKKHTMDEIVAILDSTYEINKDLFMKQSAIDNIENSVLKATENIDLVNFKDTKTTNPTNSKHPQTTHSEFRKIIEDPMSIYTSDSESSAILDVFDSGKYDSSRDHDEGKLKKDTPNELAVAQETLIAVTSPVLSRQGSSSSATSQSTARYNPGASPMSSEAEDKVENEHDRNKKTLKKIYNPKTLSTLSKDVISSLPHGEFCLDRIGFGVYDPSGVDYSIGNIDKMIQNRLKSLPPSGISTRRSSFHELENIYSVYGASVEKEPSPPRPLLLSPPPPSLASYLPNDDPWVGLPTSADRRLLVCLSPSQSKDSTMTTPKEATELLELHKKFAERRGYHEPPQRHSICSPKSERSGTPDFSSPDLIRLEPYESKRQVYTPELLIEAANLLALKEYRQSRFKSGAQSNPPKTRDSTSVKTNGSALEKNDGLSEVTSLRTKIAADSEGTDSNRSAGTSRLLALLQGSGGQHSPSNNTVPAQMDRVDKSDKKTDRAHRYSGSYISEWLTMSENVTSSADSPLRIDFNKNVINAKSMAVDPVTHSIASNAERRQFEADKYKISKQGDIAIIQTSEENQRMPSMKGERPKSLPSIGVPALTPSGGELFREQMYHEYMDKVAQRTERRQQKVIKISSRPPSVYSSVDQEVEKVAQNVAANKLESEFMDRVRERMSKLGINLDDDPNTEGTEDNPAPELPRHLQEFMELTSAPQADTPGTAPTGVWSPGATPEAQRKEFNFSAVKEEVVQEDTEPVPPVWTPKSAQASPTLDRKFRPVNFESPKLSRKTYSQQSSEEVPKPPTDLPVLDSPSHSHSSVSSSTQYLSTTKETISSNTQESSGRLVTSHSLPDTSLDSKLPRAQNPTITLLQKAREGQLPRGAHYLDYNNIEESPPKVHPNEVLYTIRKEYESETEDKRPKKIVELGPRKYTGIGPTTKEGIPIVLRSEVQDENQQKWYKRMYDSLHKAERDKDYLTVRYKSRRGRYPYTSPGGYLSEPEPLAGYDSDYATAKYATLDRRRIRNKENDFTTSTMPRSKYNAVKHAVNVYKNQPGRIEDYEPGHSSIADKETKQWWDEVMDIFDGQFEQSQKSPRTHAPATTSTNKPFMTYALKESGYESDSTLVFKRRDETQQQLSPAEQKLAYKAIQKGGDVPLHGLRKPVPEKPKEPIRGRVPAPHHRTSYPPQRRPESPHRYVESEVTIHYRSPVRSEEKEVWSEEELQRRQAEAMRRIYQEERRRKYLQELQDMYSRRHTDNFTPSQKSPIPLNRYDDFVDDLSPSKPRDRTPEPKLVARALYNFIGQTSRELTFRRGDIIYVRRQIDKNWYEGEHNAMIGLFPFNYVEIIPYDGIRTIPKRPTEGQARAKFNFQAQTHLELPLVKGELVLLTRRVDNNWFEGRIGNRKGIFPVSYVEVLVEPGERALSPVRVNTPTKPVASPAAHSLHMSNNMSQHHYQPPRPVSYTSLPRQKTADLKQAPVNQTLHIDTQNEPVPYRVLYNYKPQNEDELELVEGETVYVMEKCDDGWYVGSSQRTGYLGTFPGNYVERQV